MREPNRADASPDGAPSFEGSGDAFTADAEEKANIICGNIQTANATVYVVDTVMMPQM